MSVEKFLAYLAYINHADIVNGTRIVEQLREYSTQLSPFMYYGNFFVGKMLELKHLGRGYFHRRRDNVQGGPAEEFGAANADGQPEHKSGV
jgi:hypothetical protein